MMGNCQPVITNRVRQCRGRARRNPRSLRTGVSGRDGASIRFQALIEHILVGVEAGCDEEMLLRLGEQDVMVALRLTPSLEIAL